MSQQDKNFPRRQFLIAGAAALASPVALNFAVAQEKFPSKPIDLLVHAGAGGGTDLVTHSIIAGARSELGWDMALVRKTGAGGVVAHQYAKKQPLDGYTGILLSSGQIAVLAQGKSPISIDDIVGIARGTLEPNYLMVAADGPYKTAKDLIKAGQSKKLNVGIVTIGSGDHITLFLLSKAASIDTVQAVPIASGAEIAVNLIGGNIDAGIVGFNEAEAQIRSGRLRVLLNFGETRSSVLPDVPTAREDLGYDLVRASLRGVVVLKGTPSDRVEILRNGIHKAMMSEHYQNYLKTSGNPPDSVLVGAPYEAAIRREYDDAKSALAGLGLL